MMNPIEITNKPTTQFFMRTLHIQSMALSIGSGPLRSAPEIDWALRG
jgi:hypothetical protein